MGLRDFFSGNSRRERQRSREEAILDKRHDQALHRDLQRQQHAFNQEGEIAQEYLDTLVSHGLDEATARLLRNYLAKDFVLANYSKAGAFEAKWLSRLELLKIKGLHPRKTAILQGEYRQFMFDDASEGLTYLKPQEETLLTQALQDIMSRFTRGEHGFQQDALNKSITESITKENKSGRGERSGFFGR